MYSSSFLHISVLAIVLTLCSAPVTLFAIEGTSTPTSTATTTPSTTTPSVPTVTDTKRAKLQPVAQTRITNLAANLSNRLDATVRRLTNVEARLESRKAKMTEAGINTDAATTPLATAHTQLEAAKKSLSAIDTEVAAFVGSEDPIAAWNRLESIYTGTAANVIAAHQSLTTALNALIDAPTIDTTSATTSSSTIEQ